MGGKQSTAARSRGPFPGVSTDDSAVPPPGGAPHFGHYRTGGGAMGLRSRSVSSVAGMGMDPSTTGGVPFSLYTPASRGTGDSERAPGGGGSTSDSTYAHGNGYQETGGGHHRDGMLYLGSRASLADALPLHIAPRWFSSHSGNDEDSEYSGHSTTEEDTAEEETTRALATVTTEALAESANSTHIHGTSNQVEFILMVAVPLAALLILLFAILIVIYFKSRRPKQEPSSQGSQSALQTHDLGGETLKVPIFEEDTPSVMEIEMEELDKWMNSMNRNANYECLPTLKEEKEPNLSPSDNES